MIAEGWQDERLEGPRRMPFAVLSHTIRQPERIPALGLLGQSTSGGGTRRVAWPAGPSARAARRVSFAQCANHDAGGKPAVGEGNLCTPAMERRVEKNDGSEGTVEGMGGGQR